MDDRPPVPLGFDIPAAFVCDLVNILARADDARVVHPGAREHARFDAASMALRAELDARPDLIALLDALDDLAITWSNTTWHYGLQVGAITEQYRAGLVAMVRTSLTLAEE